MSTVIPFFRPASARQGNWSQQELAEFYRVEAALLRAGFSIASDHGLSDEGEPWFVFCRPDGDAIIHFAKIDGSYLIASDALDRPVRGTDFRTLIDQIARLHPHLLPIPATGTGTTLVVHPAALLAALVAAAALSLSSEDAHAGPLSAGGESAFSPPTSHGGGPTQGHPQPKASGGSGDRDTDRKQLEAIILSAMIFAAEAMAVDHRAVSTELNLDFAGGTGDASILTAQGDAAASGTAFGSGRGSVPAQPAVLTTQGSGANPDARPQTASDTIAAASRVDPAPAGRTESPGEAPKSPAAQNQPLAPKFGSDVALTSTSAEASAAKSSDQQASTSGRSESAAPASDEPGPDARDQRAGSASASIAEPGSHARSAPAASPDSADAGSGSARPAWGNAAPQTVTNRVPSPEASRDADDRGHSRPAEAALGNSPKVDPTELANGPVEGVGRDRESPAKAGSETHPTGEQAAPGHSQPEGAGRGRSVPAETATGRSPQAERGAESDRQATGVAAAQSAQVDTATGNTPQAGQARPDQSFVDSTGQDRGAPGMAAVGHSPKAEQVGPGQGQTSPQGQDQGAPAAASHEMPAAQTSPTNDHVSTVGPDRASSPEGASGNNLQTVPASGGNGHANGVARQDAAPAQAETAKSPPVESSSRGNSGAAAQERGPQAEPATGSNPPSAQTDRGHDPSNVIARDETVPAQAETRNNPPVEQSGRDNGNTRAIAQDRGTQAETAEAPNPPIGRTGPSEGPAGVSGPGSARAEVVIGDPPEVQPVGRASGQENANDQGSQRPTVAASGNDPHIEPTGGKNGQGQGSNPKAELVAHREAGSDAPSAGHGRAPSDANERGSAGQAEAVLPGTEQQPDRGKSQSSVPAERDHRQALEAHGLGATDTSSSHGKPDTPGETRSDAAPAPKAHALLDPDSAPHESKTLNATDLPGGAHEPTDGAAPGHAAKADQAPAAPDGHAQDLTSSPSEHAPAHPIEHGFDQAANAAALERTNGDVFGTTEHGSTPSDVAVTSPSSVHAGGAELQAWHAQEESAPHGQSADAEPTIPASAARDPVLQDRRSDRAELENPLGHGASPASDAQSASPKDEHAQAGPDGPHDGTGPVVVRAILVAGPQATVHGVDENDLSGPSGGPNLTSPYAPVSQGEIAPAHPDQGQVDDGLSVSGRTDREAPGHAADPVKANEPTQPPVKVEADLAGGPLPNSESGSAASHGASGQAKPGRPSPPPAMIDADGNLVFHTDVYQDPVPSAPPHGPDEATTHHTVGLIGGTDQTHPVHDLYHHT